MLTQTPYRMYLAPLLLVLAVSTLYLNANQEVSTGFRSQSLREQSSRALSGLNSVDTLWSPFKYYTSQTIF